jgi:hypothetical protein
VPGLQRAAAERGRASGDHGGGVADDAGFEGYSFKPIPQAIPWWPGKSAPFCGPLPAEFMRSHL